MDNPNQGSGAPDETLMGTVIAGKFGIHERLDTEDRFWSDWLWIDERID